MSDLASEDPSPSKPLCAPVLNNDVLEHFNIPGLPAAKSVKNTLKKGRKVTAVQAPGSGKNSRTGLDVSEGEEISHFSTLAEIFRHHTHPSQSNC